MEVCQIIYDDVSLKEYKAIKTATWLIKYTPDLKDKNARRFFEKTDNVQRESAEWEVEPYKISKAQTQEIDLDVLLYWWIKQQWTKITAYGSSESVTPHGLEIGKSVRL